MSINFRRPNGYFITRYNYDLLDYYAARDRRKREAERDVVEDESQIVTLVFNGTKEIRVNRRVMADSCHYFRVLLDGPFKESRESKIDIKLSENDFSYEVFEGVVKYANTKVFLRDPKLIKVQYGMIQLAALWMLDELVDIIESHFIDCLEEPNVTGLINLAIHMNLPKLKQECLNTIRRNEETLGCIATKWGRCHLPGHESHSYGNCPTLRRQGEAENWDEW